MLDMPYIFNYAATTLNRAFAVEDVRHEIFLAAIAKHLQAFSLTETSITQVRAKVVEALLYAFEPTTEESALIGMMVEQAIQAALNMGNKKKR
jgi:hypothetical protein